MKSLLRACALLLLFALTLTGCRQDTPDVNDGEKSDTTDSISYYTIHDKMDPDIPFSTGYTSDVRVFESASDVKLNFFWGVEGNYEDAISAGFHIKETEIYFRQVSEKDGILVKTNDDELTGENYEMEIIKGQFPTYTHSELLTVPEEMFRNEVGQIYFVVRGKNYGTASIKTIDIRTSVYYKRLDDGKIEICEPFDYKERFKIEDGDFAKLEAQEELGLYYTKFPPGSRDFEISSDKSIFNVNEVKLDLKLFVTKSTLNRFTYWWEEIDAYKAYSIGKVTYGVYEDCALVASDSVYAASSKPTPIPSPTEYTFIEDLGITFDRNAPTIDDLESIEPIELHIPAEAFSKKVGLLEIFLYKTHFDYPKDNPEKIESYSTTKHRILRIYYYAEGDKVKIALSRMELVP